MIKQAATLNKTDDKFKKNHRANDFIGKFTTNFSTDLLGGQSLQRKADCACGGDCPPCQAKGADLPISQPTDASEIEADQIADKVMRKQMIGPAISPSSKNAVSRKCSECREEQEEEKEKLHRKENGAGANSFAPKIVQDVLSSGGKPLEAGTRAFMESRFDRDFGNVKIHDNDLAAKSASSINALAYTSGDDIVFNSGQYEPNSESGKRLLAHELAHVVQQSGGGRKAISRAVYKVGQTTIKVDWSGITGYGAGEFLKAVLEKYESYTGSQRADIESKITAFTDDQLKKLLFAIDLLSDNPLADFDQKLGVQRLIAHTFAYEPMAADYQSRNFENEVLRVSGWFEKAFTAGLAKPDNQTQGFLNFLYTSDTSGSSALSSPTCPASRTSALNEKTLRADLPQLMQTYLKAQVAAATKGGVATQNLADITPIATIVQNEALSFFAPYIGHARNRDFLQTWKYASHLTESTAPNAIAAEARRAYIANRAKGEATDTGLFSRTNFDPRCAADLVVFNDIVDQMNADSNVQSQLNAIMSWKSFTGHGPTGAETTINLQYHPNVGECVARWQMINTLCHEILHAYTSQRFYDAAHDRRLITEGFTEVLGDELYEEISKRATNNSAYRPQFEVGIAAGGCKGVTIPPPVLEYGDDGRYAKRIEGLAGPENFKAAYFLGKLELVGLKPKLFSGQENTPSEIEADSMADKVMQTPANGSAAKNLQKKANGGAPTFAVPRIVNDIINSSSGKPLDKKTRSFMESRFEHDFGGVKIHDDGKAAKSAGAINARAYTVGDDIVFNSGAYDPNSESGKHLLAHELAHVVQQNKTAQRKIMRAVDDAKVEAEYNKWADTNKRTKDRNHADFPGAVWEFIQPKIVDVTMEPLPKPKDAAKAKEWEDDFARAEIIARWLFTTKATATDQAIKDDADSKGYYILDSLAKAGYVSKAMAQSGYLDPKTRTIVYDTILKNPSAVSASEFEVIIKFQCAGVADPASVPIVQTFTDGNASPLKKLPADKTKAIFKVLVNTYKDHADIVDAIAEVLMFNPAVRVAVSDALKNSEFGNPDLLFKVLKHPFFVEPGYGGGEVLENVMPPATAGQTDEARLEAYQQQRMTADMPWVYNYKQKYYVQYLIDLAKSQSIVIAPPKKMDFAGLRTWLDTNTPDIGRAAAAKYPADPNAIFEIYKNIADIFFYHIPHDRDAVPNIEGRITHLAAGAPASKRFEADCDVFATYAMRLLTSGGFEPIGYIGFVPQGAFAHRAAHVAALVRKDKVYSIINNKGILDAGVSDDAAKDDKKAEAIKAMRVRALRDAYGDPLPTDMRIYYDNAGAAGQMSQDFKDQKASLDRPDLLKVP